ncbi:ABC transporter ATP-binding protein [Fodinicurvata fenggangensis]|uniref:ABC transporter ATP-binding protein n=1 Tax=Fodinicurvata fenggangensis TaxID=1121830 RepID=UPI0009DEFABE|nr:ABC transporter ATP-binding protein [Fodinicurvata fenggangensis]
MNAIPTLELGDVTRRFGEQTVLDSISLAIPPGSFTSLLGASGCGKSTTLRIMAGLDRPTAGAVRLEGQEVSALTAHERNIAMVFQSYALYPHLTVAQNIALPLTMKSLSAFGRLPLLGTLIPGTAAARKEIQTKVSAAAEMLGLSHLLDRKPGTLSGGQKQRVALGRALVRDPVLFLLDEPLSNLDARLRVQMRAELVALHRRTGKPFVYVTHDQAEAMAMSDQVIVMIKGSIAQAGTPRELYERPTSLAVAEFVGTHAINLITPQQGAGEILSSAARAILGVRPEHVVPAPHGSFIAKLRSVEYLGSEIVLTLCTEQGVELKSIAPGTFEPPLQGDSVRLSFDPTCTHLFHPETGARIGAPECRS